MDTTPPPPFQYRFDNLSMAYMFTKPLELLIHRLGSLKCVVARISGCPDMYANLRGDLDGLDTLIGDTSVSSTHENPMAARHICDPWDLINRRSKDRLIEDLCKLYQFSTGVRKKFPDKILRRSSFAPVLEWRVLQTSSLTPVAEKEILRVGTNEQSVYDEPSEPTCTSDRVIEVVQSFHHECIENDESQPVGESVEIAPSMDAKKADSGEDSIDSSDSESESISIGTSKDSSFGLLLLEEGTATDDMCLTNSFIDGKDEFGNPVDMATKCSDHPPRDPMPTPDACNPIDFESGESNFGNSSDHPPRDPMPTPDACNPIDFESGESNFGNSSDLNTDRTSPRDPLPTPNVYTPKDPILALNAGKGQNVRTPDPMELPVDLNINSQRPPTSHKGQCARNETTHVSTCASPELPSSAATPHPSAPTVSEKEKGVLLSDFHVKGGAVNVIPTTDKSVSRYREMATQTETLGIRDRPVTRAELERLADFVDSGMADLGRRVRASENRHSRGENRI